jgi:hypothetical protein
MAKAKRKASPRPRSRQVKERKPREPRDSKRGHKMGEVAMALMSQYDYGAHLTPQEFETLLRNNGRPQPNGTTRHGWINSQRQHLNDFGRNRALLGTIGREDVHRHGFQLTAQRTGQSEFVYVVNTVTTDVARRDRTNEVYLKGKHVIQELSDALPFVEHERIASQLGRIIGRQREMGRVLKKESDEMIDLVRNATDAEIDRIVEKRIAARK